ncbi:major facilitator superfamily domain-containing protein [Lactarius sanguifluus]|nr:major facilitator superfamily domain-containing protein [Lactarius sanguifluus]
MSWTVGYVIGQIPSNMLITRAEHDSLTMCLALSKNFLTLCTIHFLVGLAESTFYPTIQYVIGSWYKKEELVKRSCIFHTASTVGPMVSGVLQAGVYNGLNNRGGGCSSSMGSFSLTIPIALLGFIIMPDLPTTTKPSTFYTQEQLDIAIKCMESEGWKPPKKFTKEKVLSFFSTWHIYTLFNNGNGGVTSMIFWLKSFNKPGNIIYTVRQINTYPLGIYSLQIVTTLIYAWWSDAVVARWPPLLFARVWSIITYSVLAAMPVYTHIAWYETTGCMGGLSGLIMAWVNELNSHDNESILTLFYSTECTFVVASCNMFTYVFQAWLPIVIFPQVQQPRYVIRGTGYSWVTSRLPASISQ